MPKIPDAEYIQMFHEAVPKAFASLIKDYNFTVREMNPHRCELVSQDCVLFIGRDYNGIGASIKPMRTEQMPKPRPGVPIACSIYEIINYVYPDLQLVYGNFNSLEGVLPACERVAGYVRQYCKPMLEGDFSIWPKLLERRGKG